MAKTITVKAAKGPYDDRVLLWERDADHPGGEAFVVRTKDRTFEVAETSRIVGLVRTGALKQVSASFASVPVDSDSTVVTNTSDVPPSGSDDDGDDEFADLNDTEVKKLDRADLDRYAVTLQLDPSAYNRKEDMANAVIDARNSAADE